MFPFSNKDYDFFINYTWLLHFVFDITYCYFLAIFDKAFLVWWVHVLWLQFVNSCILPTKCIQYFYDCLTRFIINFATNMFPFIKKFMIFKNQNIINYLHDFCIVCLTKIIVIFFHLWQKNFENLLFVNGCQ